MKPKSINLKFVMTHILPVLLFVSLGFICNHYYGFFGLFALIIITWIVGLLYIHIRKYEAKLDILSKINDNLSNMDLIELLIEAYNIDTESELVSILLNILQQNIKQNSESVSLNALTKDY